ncbi:hypothetical protein, partial [Burkholderia sp. SIMBA_052]|uniref:hypothetical protein n=1 Tax=Burkholderia sp. SIMBA_052 TaxID=3085793 RepID=UPI003978E251
SISTWRLTGAIRQESTATSKRALTPVLDPNLPPTQHPTIRRSGEIERSKFTYVFLLGKFRQILLRD